MKTIGIIGAGEVGTQVARAALLNGYKVVLANSRGPETLQNVIAELGPGASAVTAQEAALAGDFIVVAAPLKGVNNLPAKELAGKIVIDTNNYMPWRDGHLAVIDSGEKTVHELRQEQLPDSRVVNAFNHIKAPALLQLARPKWDPGRIALTVSSDYPEAIKLVTKLYDQFGYDAVDNGPLSESWRSGPGTLVWQISLTGGQGRAVLARNLAYALRPRFK